MDTSLSFVATLATIISHAIAASALSTIGPKELSRTRLALVLATLAMIPDLDVIGFRFGISYADARKGWTDIAGLLTRYSSPPSRRLSPHLSPFRK